MLELQGIKTDIPLFSKRIEKMNVNEEEEMKEKLIQLVEKDYLRTDIPQFKAGDTIGVYYKVKEGNKERVQLFEGVVIRVNGGGIARSEEHTSELQSRQYLVCRLLLEKKQTRNLQRVNRYQSESATCSPLHRHN